MRIRIEVEATATTVFDHDHRIATRGRVWSALDETRFGTEHGGPTPGFNFSRPIPIDDPADPWSVIEEGERRVIFVSASREGLLAAVASDLLADRELNLKEMRFEVKDVTPFELDVGPPGSEGIITTGNGVLAVVPDQYLPEDDPHEGRTYWQEGDRMEPFLHYVRDQLQRQWERFGDESLPGPAEVDGALFSGHELIAEYAKNVHLTRDVERTLILSKWRFPYSVRNDVHREHLNLAVEVGIGGRTPLGFGFLNTERTDPMSEAATGTGVRADD
jgi:CRISPR-associated endoribonuclease Cas6